MSFEHKSTASARQTQRQSQTKVPNTKEITVGFCITYSLDEATMIFFCPSFVGKRTILSFSVSECLYNTWMLKAPTVTNKIIPIRITVEFLIDFPFKLLSVESFFVRFFRLFLTPWSCDTNRTILAVHGISDFPAFFSCSLLYKNVAAQTRCIEVSIKTNERYYISLLVIFALRAFVSSRPRCCVGVPHAAGLSRVTIRSN